MKSILAIHIDNRMGHSNDPFEFQELLNSSFIKINFCTTAILRSIHPKLYFAKGFFDWLQSFVKIHHVSHIYINDDLSARHQSQIEKTLCCSLIDRTQLILKLFESRARSYEGKLQVELAKLAYLSTRLVRGWTHLERQRGGIGVRGGPGETQLELDKRILNERIKAIKEKLKKFNQHRIITQKNRTLVHKIHLVGYSNVGKSTLFEYIANKKTYHDDRLFATLDPLSAKVGYGDHKFILTDTVGFISNLPESLMNAFLATLSEIKLSNQILHVIDASNMNWLDHVHSVNNALEHLGVEHHNVVCIFNKVDLIDEFTLQKLKEEYPQSYFVSALEHKGIDNLVEFLKTCAKNQV